MNIKITDCYVPVDVNERLPQYPKIVVVLIDGRLPMMAQIRPSDNGPEWWSLGMGNAHRIEEKRKCVTHWLEKKTDEYLLTRDAIERVVEDAMIKGPDYFLEDAGTWKKFKNDYINNLLK